MKENIHSDQYDNDFQLISNMNKEVEPLFNAISDPLFIVDDCCIIKKANTSANNTFNLSIKKNEINLNFLDLILEEEKKSEILNYLRSVIKSNIIKKVEFISPSNIIFNAQIHISKNDSVGNNEFTLLIKKDSKNLENEQANQLKSEFLAQMSHEIRTPLNTMLSFTNLIEEEVKDKVGDDLSSSFIHINSSGRRIIRTIDLLLNLSEIHSGTFEYIPEEFDLLNEIINDLLPEYKYLASLKNLDFVVENSKDEYLVTADLFKVKEILKHLVENAIRFTNSGKISIKLGKDSSGKITIQVIDTGIGISKEYLPHLFSPFTQEEQGYSRKYDGNGVGLTLVKSYCEINNINISVKSRKNVGTIFTLQFN
ncbi:MAG: HAMP domain-containing histidine kinase [Melioribacteraceae bacterium]|nr:HAMP domain-containing histidine kinase [Melioribacteraceae bacterium]